MGRLVTPISKEEFEKLPKWQQWFSNHWYFILIILALLFFILLILT
jgi:ascorbate-specific PTS system EIIC-type component UlaA